MLSYVPFLSAGLPNLDFWFIARTILILINVAISVYFFFWTDNKWARKNAERLNENVKTVSIITGIEYLALALGLFFGYFNLKLWRLFFCLPFFLVAIVVGILRRAGCFKVKETKI